MTNKLAFPETVTDFTRFADEFKSSDAFRPPMLFAVGSRVFTANGIHASTRYPLVNGPGQNQGSAAVLMKVLGIEPKGVQSVLFGPGDLDKVMRFFHPFEGDGKVHGNIELLKRARNISFADRENVLVATFVFDDVAPEGVDDATLKLYGLSNRHFRPNQLNLQKIFTKFPNVAWMGDAPMDADQVDEALLDAAFGGQTFAPHMVDKFPLYVHRVNAAKLGVRITDMHKVRLGAYLGEGTTVMPGASYVNFNAGTEGPCMNEGRISSSAFVGAGTDVGGGASILGTLSGGNDVPISVGRNCLLEVNSSLGIPIGDAVIVAAETAVMASSLVQVNVEGHRFHGTFAKAKLLAGINAVTFRRNDMSGILEVVRTRRNEEFARKLENGESILSADLHSNV